MRNVHYVVGLFFDKELSQVVLIRKKRPDWQLDFLNGVGGKVETIDRSPYAAMVREFKEEAGLLVKNWKYICTLTVSDVHHVTFYAAYGNINLCHTCTDEEIEIHNAITLPEGMIPNLNYIIPFARYLLQHNNEQTSAYVNRMALAPLAVKALISRWEGIPCDEANVTARNNEAWHLCKTIAASY